MYKRKFININKVYKVKNRYLGLRFNGVHNVIIIWKNGRLQIARVKPITSLENEKIVNGKIRYIYDLKALNLAKRGIITPYSIKQLGTRHWSGIFNKSKVISFSHLEKANSNLKKPKGAK